MAELFIVLFLEDDEESHKVLERHDPLVLLQLAKLVGLQAVHYRLLGAWRILRCINKDLIHLFRRKHIVEAVRNDFRDLVSEHVGPEDVLRENL